MRNACLAMRVRALRFRGFCPETDARGACRSEDFAPACGSLAAPANAPDASSAARPDQPASRTALDPRNVPRAFASDLRAAGLQHMRIHDLRHAAASMMLRQGSSLDDVKRVLGHASISITCDTYGHLVEGRSREVADGLDRLLG